MSNVIKVNAKSKSLNISMKSSVSSSNIETEREEIFFQRQLQQYYEKGFTDGQRSATERLDKEYLEKLSNKYDEIKKIISEFDNALNEYSKEFERIVINLSLAISEKIVHREISQESVINNVLRESIKRVIGSNKIIVRLNPFDIERINSESNNIFNDDSYSKMKFEADEKIEPGGCFIETEIGNVDAKISSQFIEMKKNLEASITHDL